MPIATSRGRNSSSSRLQPPGGSTALYVAPVCADCTPAFELPASSGEMRTAAFFPGSTIGNFEPHAAERFLSSVAGSAGLMADCSSVLICGRTLRHGFNLSPCAERGGGPPFPCP